MSHSPQPFSPMLINHRYFCRNKFRNSEIRVSPKRPGEYEPNYSFPRVESIDAKVEKSEKKSERSIPERGTPYKFYKAITRKNKSISGDNLRWSLFAASLNVYSEIPDEIFRRSNFWSLSVVC